MTSCNASQAADLRLRAAAELERRRRERDGAWRATARPDQLPPATAWLIWLILAGRGWGKTRTGAETANDWATSDPGIRIALVGPTAADVRDVMVCGESGIASKHPEVLYQPSKRALLWPNGSQAALYSADEPDRLRGPQHHKAWADELAAWRYPEAWDMLRLGLRLGKAPQVMATTTPKPRAHIKTLVADGCDGTGRVVVTRGRTHDNLANLAPAFADAIKSKYEGTRLGRQELDAEILDDAAGALWRREWIDRDRVRVAPDRLARVVVAIDPAISSEEGSAETGISIAGIDGRGHIYVLDDASGRFSPSDWATRAVLMFDEHKADRIVAESNQGGEMVASTIRTVRANAPVQLVHASRGKHTRAEPIAALYEQGKVHHVGVLGALEDQLCGWDAAANMPSPDRLDALVWACTALAKPCTPGAYGDMMAAFGEGPQRRRI